MRLLKVLWRKTRALYGRSGIMADRFLAPFTSDYFTFHNRPKKSSYGALSGSGLCSEIAVVIQGPMVRRSGLTMETLRTYRKFWPNAQIIYSTWHEYNFPESVELGNLNIDVVFSKKPGSAGHANLNLQLLSTFSGLSQVDSSRQLVLKTRSDQRIYNPFALDILAFYHRFNVTDTNEKPTRLVFSSFDTFRNREYGLSDFLAFGTLEEQLTYWSYPLEPGDTEVPGIIEPTPEQILSHRYIKQKLGNAAGWDDGLRQLFAVVDNSSLDLFWPKYSAREFRWRSYNGGRLSELSQGEWFSRLLSNRQD